MLLRAFVLLVMFLAVLALLLGGLMQGRLAMSRSGHGRHRRDGAEGEGDQDKPESFFHNVSRV